MNAGWGAPIASAPPAAPVVSPGTSDMNGMNGWGGNSTADPWASNGTTMGGFGGFSGAGVGKKDKEDPFANIWQ